MPIFEEQLKILAQLDVLMRESSPETRAFIVADELSKLEKQFGSHYKLNTDKKKTIQELRWQNYQYQEFNSVVEQYEYREEDPENLIIQNNLFFIFRQRFANYANKDATEKLSAITTIPLKSIKQQKALFFSQCLAETTREYLENYKSNSNEDFSSKTILANATALYIKEVCKVALLECEVINLVGYYARLRNRTIKDRESEIKIEKQLNIQQNSVRDSYISGVGFYNPDRFKFPEIKELYSQLEDLLDEDDLTSSNLKEQLETSLPLELKESIFAAHIVTRHPKEVIESVLTEAKEMAATPIPEMNADEAPIQDERIQKLRQAAEEYKQYLDGIIIEENEKYPNRTRGAVDNREEALATIISCAYRSTEVTPHLKLAIKASVDTIKANEPTWTEQSWLAIFLDIISFPSSIYSYFTSQPDQAQTTLYQQPEALSQESATNEEEGDKDDEEHPGPSGSSS